MLGKGIRSLVMTAAFIGILAVGAMSFCWAEAAGDAEYAYETLYKSGKFQEAIQSFSGILTSYPGSGAASEANYWIGMCYKGMGKPDEALPYFQTQITQFPGNRLSPEAVIRVGECYQDKKQYDLAIAEFEKVAAEHADLALRAHFLLGGCYQVQDKLAQAISALKAALSSAPASTPKDDYYYKAIRYKLAECYRQAFEWDEAIPVLDGLIQDYPEDSAYHKTDLGTCYEGKHDYERALQVYLEAASGSVEALYRAAAIYVKQEKYDQAISCLERVKTEYPDDILRAYIEIGGCYRKQGKYAEAIAAFRKGVELAPSERPAWCWWPRAMEYQIAECYRDSKDYDRAIAEYQGLSAKYPEDAAGNKFEIATCLRGKGSGSEAEAAVNEAIAAAPDDPALPGFWQLSEELRLQGKYREQIAYLDRVGVEKPTLKQAATITKGEVYAIYLGDHYTAMGLYQQAISEAPNTVVAGDGRRLLAQEYYGLRRYDDAIGVCDECIARYPESTSVYNALTTQYCKGRCHAAKNELDQAVMAYETALTYPGASGFAESVSVRVELARAYACRGELAKAVEQLDVVRDTAADTGKRARALYLKGQYLKQAGDASGAKLAFQELVDKFKDNYLSIRATEQLAGLK